jgi:hypothetical protein
MLSLERCAFFDGWEKSYKQIWILRKINMYYPSLVNHCVFRILITTECINALHPVLDIVRDGIKEHLNSYGQRSQAHQGDITKC